MAPHLRLRRFVGLWTPWPLLVVGADFCIRRFEGDCHGIGYKFLPAELPADPAFTSEEDSAPAFVDWDSDGDQDLVLRDYYGHLQYGEQVRPGHFTVYLEDDTANPFRGLSAGEVGVPAFVDWDADGRPELVVSGANYNARYFKRSESGQLEELKGGGNPFQNLSGIVAFVDWDGDSDSDVVVGTDPSLRYFENVAKRNESGKMVERLGASNPFNSVEVQGFVGISPAFVDWDLDGDVDFVLGGEHAGLLYYYERVSMDRVQRRITAGEGNAFASQVFSRYSRPAFADLDDDGEPELVVGSRGGLSYVKRAPAGTLDMRIGTSNPFYNIRAPTDKPAPTFGDFDGDGDEDLVVGGSDGKLHYFPWERIEGLKFSITAEQHGEHNPLANVSVPGAAVPALVDVDGDGDLDVVVLGGDSLLHYFEHLHGPDGLLVERLGEANPFNGIKAAGFTFVRMHPDRNVSDLVVTSMSGTSLIYYSNKGTSGFFLETSPLSSLSGPFSRPTFVDLDRDGDLDLVVAIGGNYQTMRYFEQLSQNTWLEKTDGENPFSGISLYGISAWCMVPVFVDLSGFGRKDLVLGNYEHDLLGGGISTADRPDPGWLAYFVRDFCQQGEACDQAGVCDQVTGQCACTVGYAAPSCATCQPNYYTRGAGYPRQCVSCSGDGSRTCANRGVCLDDAKAKSNTTLSRTEAMLAVGTGSCTCSEACFSGETPDGRLTCAEGACPAGTYEEGQVDGTANRCKACPAGRYSIAGTFECKMCGRGRFAGVGQGAGGCAACALGRFAPTGSVQCTIDFDFLCMLTGCFGIELVAAFILCSAIRRRVRIIDIAQLGGKVIVQTLDRHRIKIRSGESTRVSLRGTGNPSLDRPGVLHRVRVLDPTRLELLPPDEKGFITGADSSMGTLTQCFPEELLDRGEFVPTAAVGGALLLAPWLVCAVAALEGFFAERNAADEATIFTGLVLSVLVGVALAAAERWRYAGTPTPIQHRQEQFRRELLEQGVAPRSSDRGPRRAVQVAQIKKLREAFSDFIQGRSAYYLDANIVRPLTAPHKLSYAELVGASRLDFFVSHFWGNPFTHLVAAVEAHARSTGTIDWQALAYWVCFLSNNQYRVKEELGHGEWQESSFYKALQSPACQATCMVLDVEALALTRSWCLFEVLQTYRLLHGPRSRDFKGLLYCTHVGVMGSIDNSDYNTAIALANRLGDLNVANASASNEDDQRMITNLVEDEGGMEHMNWFIRQNMAQTLTAVETSFERDMALLHRVLSSETSAAGPPMVVSAGPRGSADVHDAESSSSDAEPGTESDTPLC